MPNYVSKDGCEYERNVNGSLIEITDRTPVVGDLVMFESLCYPFRTVKEVKTSGGKVKIKLTRIGGGGKEVESEYEIDDDCPRGFYMKYASSR